MLIHCNGGQQLLPWLLSNFSTEFLQKLPTEHLTTPVPEGGLFLLRVGAFERKWPINLNSFHVDRWRTMDKCCFISFLSPISTNVQSMHGQYFLSETPHFFVLLRSTSVLPLFYIIGFCCHYSSHFSVLPYTVFSVMLPFTISGRHFRFTHILSPIIPAIRWSHKTRWQRILHESLK